MMLYSHYLFITPLRHYAFTMPPLDSLRLRHAAADYAAAACR